jgi:hypothetical protein
MGTQGRWREGNLWRILTPIHTDFGTCTVSMAEQGGVPRSERYTAHLYAPGDVLLASTKAPTTWACEAWARGVAGSLMQAREVVMPAGL